MKDQTLTKLDRISPVWVLKQINLGNLIRGVCWVRRTVESAKECVVSTVAKVKEAMKEVEKEVVEIKLQSIKASSEAVKGKKD